MTLTEGKPWRSILIFTMPVLLGILLQQLYNTVDTIIVGNFTGEAALSALGTTGCITSLFLAFANGFSAGANVIIAQLFGAGKTDDVRKTASTSLILLLGMGILVSIIGIGFCVPVLNRFLGVQGNILIMSVNYLRIYSAGLVFQFGYNVVAAILRGVGDSKASLYFLIVASLVNVVLDVLFVAVFRWGCTGAAIATDLAQAASFVAALFYMYRKYPVFRWRLSELHFDSEVALQVLWAGLPMMLQQAVASCGFVFLQRAVNSYGQSMMASYTVGQRIEMYLDMPFIAYQTTMATYTGQNIGAKKFDRVILGLRQTILLSFCSTLCISILVYCGAPLIIWVFALSEQAATYCFQHIRFTAIVKLIIATYFPIIGMFQGIGKGFIGMAAVASALVVRVITTYTFCYIPFIGYHIVWGNQLFGFSTACMIMWGNLLFGKWKRGIMEQEKNEIG